MVKVLIQIDRVKGLIQIDQRDFVVKILEKYSKPGVKSLHANPMNQNANDKVKKELERGNWTLISEIYLQSHLLCGFN